MNQAAIHIRAASPKDASSIHHMLKALAAGMGMGEQIRSTADDILRYGFGDTRCFEVLIAEIDGLPIGLCLYFFTYSSWAGKRGVYVQDIYVDERARGTGLGRRLLAETAKLAAEQGAAFMRLAVDKDNQAARDFYAHAGMIYADRDCIYKAWDERFESLQQI
ncbi:MAG: GNAT family N-acetyltransferase [Xanthomonadales bacterium]|nr:GNAT family N-acetyltransferase [Xanthomonadales bacterium]